MKSGKSPISAVLLRCLKLSCPACGASSIVAGPFKIKHHCTSCSALFKREDGFFVGAIMANVVTTEMVILLAYFLCLLFIIERVELMMSLLFVLALLFPVAFYHHSWSLWLSFDYMVESLPKYAGSNSE